MLKYTLLWCRVNAATHKCQKPPGRGPLCGRSNPVGPFACPCFLSSSGFTQSPAAGVLAQPPQADDILKKDSLTPRGAAGRNHMSWCVPCTYMGVLACWSGFCPSPHPRTAPGPEPARPIPAAQEGMGRLRTTVVLQGLGVGVAPQLSLSVRSNL